MAPAVCKNRINQYAVVEIKHPQRRQTIFFGDINAKMCRYKMKVHGINNKVEQ